MLSPPSGTVTFLFTDIEGSTRLWEQSPDAMRLALSRHDRLLRETIEVGGGFIFKRMGDAFCAAFADPAQAVQAALAAQVAVQAEPWPANAPLRIRIALHTGAAQERDGDYFGPSLNRVARLLAVAHGGQTLLSGTTQEGVQNTLPPAVTLLDLGTRRLKDLGQPEHVTQMAHPSLPAQFPPLRSLDNPDLPNNLPQQVTSFIGREKEINAIQSLLAQSRLLTTTGAGGAGKTRLSLEAAFGVRDRYFDGVWLVELASLSDPALVPQAMANVLGVREERGHTLTQTLAGFLRPKHMLLILDNCEHLLPACASLVHELLKACPQVFFLASSREPLGMTGEQNYPVPMLSLPGTGGRQTVDSVSRCEAVQLFVERAKLTRPAFAVTASNAPAVAQVCRHLDGIPLALELAAARVRSLSAEQIAARLDDRFALLTGGSRTALPRQQTLRALVDWSFDLLNPPEQTLLQSLSVFAGGWTLDAAERVGRDALDVLTSLVDKSLVMYEARATGDGRYGLLETVRQYARDRLTESGDSETVRGQHAAYFLELAEQASPLLRGPEGAAWLERLETEHSNLRASLTWYAGHADRSEDGLRLAAALWRFWAMRGHYSEGRQWLNRMLESTRGSAPSTVRAHALNGAGNLAQGQGGSGLALPFYEQSLALYRQLEDQRGIANTLNNLGNAALEQNNFPAARTLFEESLSIQRQLDNPVGIAMLLNNLGNLTEGEGDLALARALHKESLTISRRIGNQQGIAGSLNNLADLAFTQGEYAEAQTLFHESLSAHRLLGDMRGIMYCLEGLGAAADRHHRPVRAIRLWAAARSMRETFGIHMGLPEHEEIDRRTAAVRELLSAEDFAAAWDAGQAMSLDEAVDDALFLDSD